jgi:hypothetical protein
MSQLQVTGEAKIRDIQGPVVANSGVITALDGAASQYVRGDGTLADFPTSSGGGSSVSYYLNSSVSQGTIGGVAYRELNKEPIIGAGTDIAISSNGYVASYLTDANDPDVLSIPGGNFNCEFYFSVNNNTGNPFFYAELYKYDGTTFTLLGSSVGVPEYINQGTIIAPYYFAIPVATAALALTDRLAIRIYVNVDGRTVTLHTENGHLCQVVTTLSKGMVSLNNLTDQSQYLTTGTSGTDFNIVSSGDTHTFNIPNAGVADRGLITNLAQTIGGAKTFSSVLRTDGGFLLKDSTLATVDGYTSIGGVVGSISIGYAISSTPYINDLEFAPATSNTYTFPNASGTLALTSNLSSYVPYTGATADVNLGVNFLIANAAKFDGSGSFGGHIALKQNGTAAAYTGYATLSSIGVNKLNIYYGEAAAYATELDNSLLTQSRLYKFPDLSGTLALLEGSQTFSGSKIFSNSAKFTSLVFVDRQINISKTPSLVAYTGGYITNYGTTSGIIYADGDTSNLSTLNFNFGGNYTYTFPAATGTIALTSNLSSYVPYTGATGAVNLGAFGLSASSISLTDSVYLQNNKSIWGTDFAGTTQYNLLSLNISNKVGIDAAGLGVVFGGTIGNGTYTYTLPSATGTLALTSDLSAYLPLTGGTLTGALGGTSASFSSSVTASSLIKSGGTSSQYLMADGSTSTLTNPVTGTGTTNYLPKFTGASTIGNSQVFDNGSGVTINGTTVGEKFNVNGFIGLQASNTQRWHIGADTGNTLYFVRSGIAERMVLTSDGNLGLGVTPSAWVSSVRAIQIGALGGTVITANTSAGGTSTFGQNWYFDDAFRYAATGTSSYYSQGSGAHIWYQAPSGTAGNAISFTQAMTLDASGRLFVGLTSGYSNGVTIKGASDDYALTIAQSNSSTAGWGMWADTGGNFKLARYGTTYNSPALTITLAGLATFSQAATFSSSVTSTNYIINEASANRGGLYPYNKVLGSGTDYSIGLFSEGEIFLASGGSATKRFTMSTTGAATFTQSNGAQIRLLNYGGSSAKIQGSSGTLAIDGNNATTLEVNSSEVLRATSGGNVGIGTTSPSYKLQVQSTSGTIARITDGTNNLDFYCGSGLNEIAATTSLLLTTNGATRLTISSTGAATFSSSAIQLLTLASTASNGSYLAFTNSGTLNGAIGNGSNIISGLSNSDLGIWTTGIMAFQTNASERMRITSGGEVYIAGTTDQGAYNLQVNGTGVWGAGAYVNGSDFRLKDNIIDLDNSLDLITKMKPVTYNYKESYSKDSSTQTGFIAQDLQELLKHKSYVDGIVKQGPKYMSVAYQNLIPLLVKAIQEQQAQIELLSNKILALESK